MFGTFSPPSGSVIDASLFREGMSRVAGAVHIVTTSGPAGSSGFTATAVTSVSDTPPTILVCLASNSRTLPLMAQNTTFCINTLAHHHRHLADVFAGRTGAHGHERLATGNWVMSEHQSPYIPDALAVFMCKVTACEKVATHTVILGTVENIILGPPAPGLVYMNRHYHSFDGDIEHE